MRTLVDRFHKFVRYVPSYPSHTVGDFARPYRPQGGHLYAWSKYSRIWGRLASFPGAWKIDFSSACERVDMWEWHLLESIYHDRNNNDTFCTAAWYIPPPPPSLPSWLQWAAWSPPTWVCECVQAPVTGLCAVPPNLLSKRNNSCVKFEWRKQCLPQVHGVRVWYWD